MKKLLLILLPLLFLTAGLAPAYAADAPTGSGSDDTSTAFVPLTNIPFIDQAGNASTLPNFLNQIYKICIGLAAVLAVLQIIRAGIMYMGGDSVTEKSAARSLIVQSLLGLLLVLSPVIVFSIINPSILSLKIGGLDALAPSGGGASASCTQKYNPITPVPAGKVCDTGKGYSTIDSSCCSAGVAEGGACCGKPVATNEADALKQCNDKYAPINATPTGKTCDAALGYKTIESSCCTGAMVEGGLCCGVPKTP